MTCYNGMIVPNKRWMSMLSLRKRLWCSQGRSLVHQIPLHSRWLTSDVSPIRTPSEDRIRLRPYQVDTIKALVDYFDQGGKRAGVSLATGSGKTVVFTQLIDAVPPRNEYATRTLILAHRQELVTQAFQESKRAHPEKNVEIELGKEHASGIADITVASVQSITSKERIEKYDPTFYKLIIVDEAHHIVSPTYLSVLEHFGLRHRTDDSPLLAGFSATLSRPDGLRLGTALDHIVYHKDYVDMIDENWLSCLRFTTVAVQADLTNVKSGPAGDFQTSSLSKAFNTSDNNDATFKAWQESAGSRKSTLVFCVDIQHVHDLAAIFVENGIQAQFVTHETHAKSRNEILNGFKNQEFPVLLNCGVFTEGTDIPNIDCVLLARPTKSRNLLIQMMGRGLRLHSEKDDCLIIDLVSSLKTGIVTTPTLFGLDPDELVSFETFADLKRRQEENDHAVAAAAAVATGVKTSPQSKFQGTLTFTEYDCLDDLLRDSSGERHIREQSSNAWVQVDNDRYILSTNTGNYITISKDSTGESYLVTYTARIPRTESSRSPYMRPRIISTATVFDHALHAADTYAGQVFKQVYIAKGQPWRRAPASDKQISALNKQRDEDNKLEPGQLTKGQAVDMITKLKFGAKGRFNKLVAGKQRMLKGEQTLERKLKGLMIREKIQVGPLVSD